MTEAAGLRGINFWAAFEQGFSMRSVLRCSVPACSCYFKASWNLGCLETALR